MSVVEVSAGFNAGRKFWATPELVEKLVSYLDLASIKQLAESHKLTRKILGKSFIWNQLIKRNLPKAHNIEPDLFDFPQDDIPQPHHVILASEQGKMRLLTGILGLSEDGDRYQLWMDLVHAICERHTIQDPNYERQGESVDVGCSCGRTHTVSFLGFLLLQEVHAREQEILLCVERVNAKYWLDDPTLTALGSLVADQEGMVKKLDVDYLYCENKKTAEAIATLVERSETVMQDAEDLFFTIVIEEDIKVEGWAAIRRAVEHLSAAFEKVIFLCCIRKSMTGGRKEDLKAIWENVFAWKVNHSELPFEDEDDRFLEFIKNLEGGGCGWEGVNGQRRGLEAVINMTEEEWLEELSKYGKTLANDSEEENEDSEEENEDSGQEEGEDPGPQ